MWEGHGTWKWTTVSREANLTKLNYRTHPHPEALEHHQERAAPGTHAGGLYSGVDMGRVTIESSIYKDFRVVSTSQEGEELTIKFSREPSRLEQEVICHYVEGACALIALTKKEDER